MTRISNAGICTLRIRFDPIQGGVKTAELTIMHSDPDKAPYTVTLIGDGRNKYTETTRISGHRFGNSVAIDGDYAIVGAVGNSESGDTGGAGLYL